MVKAAQGTQSDAEQMVAKFAAYYTPAILIFAFAVGVYKGSMYESLVILVAGCPCALLGAAPFVHAAALA